MNVSRIRERIVETPRAWRKNVVEADNSTVYGSHLKDEHKKLFDLSPIGILFIDMKGIIRYCNPAAYDKAGYSEKDFIGKYFSDLAEMANIGKRDLTGYYKMFNSMINGVEFEPFDFDYKCKDGTTGYTEIHVSLLKEEGSNVGIIVYMIDVTERKQAEKALRESEEKSTKAFRSSPNSVAVTTLKDGRFIEVNDTYSRITGYSREEVIGHSTAEFGSWTNPEERKRILQILKKKGSVRDEEVHLLMKSGEERVTLFSAEPITIDGEPCMISVATDITERKRAEETIRESEEFSTSILKNAPNPITVVSPDTTIRYVNPAFEKLTGFSLKEVIGTKAPFPWWPKERRAVRLKGLKSFMAGGHKIQQQVVQNKNGERFLIELNMVRVMHNGEFKYYVAHWKDVTKRKQAEEALAKEAIRRRILMEQSRDGIVILDQNGKVYEANRQFAEMIGYSPEEVLQLSVWDWEFLFPPEKVKEMIQTVDEAGDHFETKHRRKDGTVYDVEISTNGAMFAGQKLIFCVCRDITERKAAEEARQTILKTAIDGFWLSNLEGEILEVNDSYCQMVGYTREELLKMSVSDIEAIESPEGVAKHMRRIIEKGYDRFESQHRRKDGRIINVEISVNHLDVGEGQFFVFARDITERKQAEEALKESQEFSTRLLENAPNQVVVINPDTSVRYVNQSFVDANGWTFDEAVGQRVPYPWWPEEGREELLEGFKLAMEQGSGQGEVIARKKNGEHYWISMNWTTVKHDGEPQFMLVNSTDITERKQAEEALVEAEKKYRDLLDNTNELIQSVTPDGYFRYVNNGWKQVLGYSDDDIANLTVYDIIHPDYLQSYKMMFENINPGEDIGQVNLALISKNGNRIIVEGNITCKFENDELVYTRSIYRDITKNRYLEEQMFRLSSAVSMSTDCIVITDFDAKIIDINQKTLEMYGANSKDELVGKHFLELITPAERVMVNMDVKEIMEKGSLECREYSIVSKNGREFPMQMSTSLVRNAEGKPMGMVRVGRELDKLN